MKYCKNCGKQVSDATVFCPSCNEPVGTTSESSQFIPHSEDYYIIKSSAKKSRTIMILAVCSVLFGFCSYLGLLFTAGVFVMARNLNIPGEDAFSRPQSEIAEIKRVRRRVLIAKIISLIPVGYVVIEILLSVVIYLITLLPPIN